jgi:predicted RNase H-like HicB family nuclease
MTRYIIIIEQAHSGFSAYSPDLPGCVSTGATRADAETNIKEAIRAHLDELRAGGDPPPRPSATVTYVDVAA